MSDADAVPSAYVVALTEEREMYARSVHRDRTAMVDAELAANGWAVNRKGDLVKVDVQKNVPTSDPPAPRAHKERAVPKVTGVEKAVDSE